MPQLYFDKRQSVTTILTAAVGRYRFVGFDGAHATQAGGLHDVQGVSEEAGAIGEAISLVVGYSHPVEAAEAIEAGALVAPSTDGTGRAVVATGDNCGRAVTAAAAAGDMIVVVMAALGVVPAGVGALMSGARTSDAVSRAITADDNGKFLAPTGALTYTIPAGLTPMPSFTVDCPPSGTITVARSGGATLNGAGTSLTRTRANNPVGFVVLAHSETDAYGVSGS